MTCRYFIVIDDVWETRDWKNIGLALVENDRGSIVIKTTRKSEVATGVNYQLRRLSDDDSKKLLYTRLFDSGGECPANLPAEAFKKIMRKCGGVPLAIITMVKKGKTGLLCATLLVSIAVMMASKQMILSGYCLLATMICLCI